MATIPTSWEGQPVELELWLGGEGLVRLSTGYQAALDPFHHAYPLTDLAAGGEEIGIEAEVMPKGMFGSHIAESRIERAHLVVPHRSLRDLITDLDMVLEACEQLGDHEVVFHLLSAAERALARVHAAWPTATDVTVSRLVLGYRDPLGSGVASLPGGYASDAWDVRPYSMPIWHLPDAPQPLGSLPDAAIQAVDDARTDLAASLQRIGDAYPPTGRLALTGHAHIDLAWLWPVAETRKKGRRTFSTVLNLMDRYPDFTFNQSSAQLYSWVEEDDPALFAGVRERVAEGRWETVGGSWVEPDCQITGGEAFVRQLLYGQRYFQETFGRRHTVAWLPDVFGFSGAIPQLLRGAGLTGFFTIKLNWNEINRFPHDLFEWEGIDGSRVTANMCRNLPPAHGYNGTIRPRDSLGTWREFDGKRRHPESLLPFGWGDGGGGPTAKMLDNFERIKEFPALPRLRMTLIAEYFGSLPTAGLPRWVGELYLEFHRGTLTTQAKTKRLNREGEHRLLEAEAFAALAVASGAHGSYPREELDTAWKRLLLNQFHDILPGSSIAEVYVDAHRDGEATVADAVRLRDRALWSIAASGEGPSAPTSGSAAATAFLVANASLVSRSLTVLLPSSADPTAIGIAGESLPAQRTDQGVLIHAPATKVPGLGWTTVGATANAESIPTGSVRVERTASGVTFENVQLRIEVGADGSLHRLLDRQQDREVLADRANQLWAWADKPRVYDAWDIEADYEAVGEELTQAERIDIIEDGPLRVAVRVTRRWRHSTIQQTYRLLAGSRRLDIVTEIDWHERQVYLQARFPLAVRSHEATFETMFGAVRRPTHRNTSWDAARFESCAHRWVDLSEPGYGVALLNDGKYGHAAHDNLLSISLLRGPLYPDPYADEGEHRFIYSLLPHVGDWTTGEVAAEAFALNSPLVVVPLSAGVAPPPNGEAFATVEGSALALAALKQAEDGDGLILRLYEPHGDRGTARLRFHPPPTAVEETNLLEEPLVDGDALLSFVGKEAVLGVRPFGVISLRLQY